MPARCPRSKLCVLSVIFVLLTVQFIVGALTAASLTVTHDEYWHIPVGLLNWKTGRFDWEPLNPPLLRMWGTWPLLFVGAESPQSNRTGDLGQFGDEFLQANPDRYERLVFWARLPIVLLMVATGALLARWAWEWHGPAAACLVAWLWTRDPTVLGHGSLLTTDVGAAACWTATLYAAWKFAVQPNRRWGVILGLALGLSQAAKFTNVLLLPLVIAVWVIEWWPCSRTRESSEGGRLFAVIRLRLHLVAIVIGVAWLSLNGAFLFRGTLTPLKSFEFQSRSARAWQTGLGVLAALPVPLPRDYVVGIDRQKAVMEAEHPVFLDLEWSTKPFPRYYVMTLVYKLPHATQLVLFGGLIATLWRRVRLRSGIACCLLPAGVLLLAASWSGMQLGIRYVLPVLPLLFLFAARIVEDWTWPAHRFRTVALIVLLAIFDPWHVHPEYLAYFNELAGGVEGGREHLLDSNLDWGQDLHELKRFLDEHPVEPLSLAYFGTLPPESLGIHYQPPPPQPRPGWHVVSANFVMGRPHVIRDGRGGSRAVGLDEFGYFRGFTPKRRLGASLDVYHLTAEDIRRWQAGR